MGDAPAGGAVLEKEVTAMKIIEKKKRFFSAKNTALLMIPIYNLFHLFSLLCFAETIGGLFTFTCSKKDLNTQNSKGIASPSNSL